MEQKIPEVAVEEDRQVTIPAVLAAPALLSFVMRSHNIFMKVFTKHQNGFTLVETMIAITILTFAVAGPLFTASRVVVAAQTARNQLIASYLAQEGIEYIRLMRDNEYLLAYVAGGTNVSNNAWSSFLSGGNSSSITACRTATCTLDPTRNMGSGSGFSLQPCTGNSCGQLYLANGIYTQRNDISGSSKTPFTRTIQVADISGTPNEYPDKRVTSTVSWGFHGTPYSVIITEHLTPWQ
jgi:prepilin-type N-terminal cleavage/methylation domain-containing protein